MSRSQKEELARPIASALKRFEKAEAMLLEKVREQQLACEHEFCWEVPFQGGEYACLNPRRICTACRLEEEGSVHSGGNLWSQVKYQKSLLEHSIVLMVLNRDEFYGKRLPVVPPAEERVLED